MRLLLLRCASGVFCDVYVSEASDSPVYFLVCIMGLFRVVQILLHSLRALPTLTDVFARDLTLLVPVVTLYTLFGGLYCLAPLYSPLLVPAPLPFRIAIVSAGCLCWVINQTPCVIVA